MNRGRGYAEIDSEATKRNHPHPLRSGTGSPEEGICSVLPPSLLGEGPGERLILRNRDLNDKIINIYLADREAGYGI